MKPIECLKCNYDSYKGDVWQLGILFFYMLLYKNPFSEVKPEQQIQNIQNTNVTELLKDVPQSYYVFTDIIPLMLNIDPT